MNNAQTFRTRVQLKSDTEENWNKAGPKENSAGFIPLLGELIVYISDATHSYSRLKVGDGSTNVVSLPFIDAGTICGDSLPEDEVLTYADKSLFPNPGVAGKLYVDSTNQTIYCYDETHNIYSQLSNFTYTPTTAPVANITYWRTGSITSVSIANGRVSIVNGIVPTLNYETLSVVRAITKVANE